MIWDKKVERVKKQRLLRVILISALTVVLVSIPAMARTVVTKASWGNAPNGQAVEIYSLKSPYIDADLTTYGARLVGVQTPDKAGRMADVILGYGSLNEYVADRKTYSGSTVGCYANRIVGGRFTIEGREYRIPPNNNSNAIHGGPEGFDRKVPSRYNEQTQLFFGDTYFCPFRRGRYILSPSDHFFDARPELLAAYADEEARCKY